MVPEFPDTDEDDFEVDPELSEVAAVFGTYRDAVSDTLDEEDGEEGDEDAQWSIVRNVLSETMASLVFEKMKLEVDLNSIRNVQYRPIGIGARIKVEYEVRNGDLKIATYSANSDELESFDIEL